MLGPRDEPDAGSALRASLERRHHLADHQLVREARRRTGARMLDAALLQGARTFLSEFVNQVPVVGRGAVALLMRTRDVEVRPAREKIEPMELKGV